MSVRGKDKHRIEVTLTDELYQRFLDCIKADGYSSMAEVLRHLIVEYCNRKEPKI